MQRILVLGSGQLGLMLAEAGARWGMTIDLLDIDQQLIHYGSSRTARPLDDFDPDNDYDIITIEREHLPDTALVNTLRQHPGWRGEQALINIADRQRQKAMLDRLKLPTAPWLAVATDADLVGIHDRLGPDVILKVAKGGYDGRGQWHLQADKLVSEPLLPPGSRAIAEQQIPFEREVSIIGARNRADQCVFYPLTWNVHIAGMLRHSVAPAPDSTHLQQQAETILRTIMRGLDYEGVMAAELFVKDKQLLVNEIAPRVHNSGHWTQTGADPNQFQLHLLALMNYPLPTPQASGFTGMLNIVGLEFTPDWLTQPGIDVHWYGKSVREGRKLGHINLVADSHQELLRRLDETHRLLYDRRLNGVE
ncbi:MAG: ATP-grasp domain-containing protein [Gammaproteobacteria bacterium]